MPVVTPAQSSNGGAARAPAAGSTSGGFSQWVRWTVFVVLLACVGVYVVHFADAGELWRVLHDTDPWWLYASLGCTVLSYALMAKSYEGIACAAGARVSFREWFKITMVANTMNYVIAAGGLSGFAVRIYFLNRLNVPTNAAIVTSLAQTLITNASLLFFVTAGFLYLFRIHPLEGVALYVTAALLVLFVIALVLFGILLLHPRVRRRTLFLLGQTAHWLMHRVVPHRAPRRTHIWRYQHDLNKGIEFLLSRKREMVLPTFYIFLDWVVTLLILHTAFFAVGYPIHWTYTVVGFAIGMLTSVVSVVPGGLGIMEGSMATIYTTLGVDLEAAVVASLIFRVAFHVLPVLLSVVFFHGMFVQGRTIGRKVRSGGELPHA